MHSRFKPFAFLIHEFNVLPTRHMHKSWFKQICNHLSVVDVVMGHPRSEKRVAAFIAEKFALESFYDFFDPLQSIALLEAHALEKLIIYTGLAVHSGKINQIIEGRKIKQIKQRLGDEAYRFAIERAPLYTGEIQIEADMPFCWNQADLIVKKSGHKCIGISLGDQCSRFTNRLRLKLEVCEKLELKKPSSEKEQLKARTIVRKILFNEVAPQWKDILLQ